MARAVRTDPVHGPIELEYEAFGSPLDPTIVLLPGLGNQLLLYPEELCEGFVDRGFQAVRMDNRDAGLSTTMPDEAEYTLSDMADDVIAVLDDLGVDDAVLCGMSLGGMVAQTAAIDHPERVRLLVSVGSSTGEAGYGEATPEAWEGLLRPEASTPAEQVTSDLEVRRLWSNPEWFDEEQMRAYFTTLYERAWTPGGGRRQGAAVTRSGSREAGLRTLDVPTLVVHGEADTLISPSGGRRTAELVPGAEYLEIPGMSHDFVSQMWAPLIEAVTAATARSFSS